MIFEIAIGVALGLILFKYHTQILNGLGYLIGKTIGFGIVYGLPLLLIGLAIWGVVYLGMEYPKIGIPVGGFIAAGLFFKGIEWIDLKLSKAVDSKPTIATVFERAFYVRKFMLLFLTFGILPPVVISSVFLLSLNYILSQFEYEISKEAIGISNVGLMITLSLLTAFLIKRHLDKPSIPVNESDKAAG